MGITIREADIDREIDLIRTTFNANRAVPAGPARFRWLYFDNPDGRAKAWVALDDRTGEVAGVAAVLPRRVRVARDGSQVIAWNGADFSINRRYRTMGVAVKLRRVACDAVDRGECAFLFAHPNNRMLPVQLRAGCHALGRMVRHAKLLRVRTGGPPVRAVASAGLRLMGTDWLVRVRHDVEWRRGLVTPADVTDLFVRVADRIGTAIVRDAAYLDWRFRRNPMDRNEMLLMRSDDRVTGYLVVASDHDVAWVRDWLAESPDALDQLFSALIREMRGRGVAAIFVTALETHVDLPRLGRLGFVQRPDFSTAIAYAPSSSSDQGQLLDPVGWYMTLGDRHG